MATTKRTVEVELSTTGLDAQGKPKRVPLVVDESGQPVSYEAPPGIEPDLEGDRPVAVVASGEHPQVVLDESLVLVGPDRIQVDLLVEAVALRQRAGAFCGRSW